MREHNQARLTRGLCFILWIASLTKNSIDIWSGKATPWMNTPLWYNHCLSLLWIINITTIKFLRRLQCALSSKDMVYASELWPTFTKSTSKLNWYYIKASSGFFCLRECPTVFWLFICVTDTRRQLSGISFLWRARYANMQWSLRKLMRASL